MVNKPVRLFLTAPDLEGEDRCAAIGKILLIQGMVWVLRQAGMVDLLHLGMIGQKRYHFLCIFYMAIQPQRQGFHSLEQQKRIEGREGGAGIPQENGPDIGDKSCRPAASTKETP